MIRREVSRSFESQVRARGEAIVARRTIRLEPSDPSHGIVLRATAFGTAVYDVRVQEQRQQVRLSCTCPYFAGGDHCKHLWAMLLAADQAGRLPPSMQDVPLRARLPAGAFAPSPVHSSAPSAPSRQASRTPRSASAPRSSRWYTALSMATHRAGEIRPSPAPVPLVSSTLEFAYLLHLAVRPAQQPLAISVCVRKRAADGTRGPLKTSRLPLHTLLTALGPEDRRVGAMLSGLLWQSDGGMSASLGTAFVVPPVLFPGLYAALAPTGRVWIQYPGAEPVGPVPFEVTHLWRAFLSLGEPVSPPGVAAPPGVSLVRSSGVSAVLSRVPAPIPAPMPVPLPVPAHHTRLTIGLERADTGERWTGALPTLYADHGLVASPSALGLLVSSADQALPDSLQHTIPLDVPVADLDLALGALANGRLPVALRVDPSLGVQVRSDPPTPVATFRQVRPDRDAPGELSATEVPPRWHASYSFDYAGERLTPSSRTMGMYDPSTKIWTSRDLDVEAALTHAFHAACPSREYVGHGEDPYRHVVRAKQAVSVWRSLLRAGWRVEVDGKGRRMSSGVQAAVTSGVDWFALHGTIRFGDTEVGLTDALAALRRGATDFMLPDGTVAVLTAADESTLKRLAQIASLSDDDGRFQRRQVSVLDALLATLPEVDVDELFARARTEIAAFTGVQPLPAPPGFRGTLRPYQELALGWFDALRRVGLGGCLADDMGLGKTVQVLAMLEARRAAGAGCSLVVVPRTLVGNWIDEAARFTPDLRVLDWSGSARRGRTLSLTEADLVVMTYGTLRADITTLRDVPFDYAILDEAQAIKNPKTASAKAARLLQATHRLTLTGTPIENRADDLWSLMDYLNPGLLGAATVFKQLASDLPVHVLDEATVDALAGATAGTTADVPLLSAPPDAPAGAVADEPPGALAPDVLAPDVLSGAQAMARAIRPMLLRRLKQDVEPDLPERTEQTLRIPLDHAQQTTYDALLRVTRAKVFQEVESRGLAGAQMHVLEALLRLRQAACHTALLPAAVGGHGPGTSAKFDTLLPMLAECVAEGHKVLVFSQFTTLLALLKPHLDHAHLAYSYLDGKTKQRSEVVRAFQAADGPPVCLISLKAGGYGLNLTAADYVFLLDPWWNPAVEAQAIDRTHRIGQTKPVVATRLVAAGTVEEKILLLQASKQALATAIVGGATAGGLGALTRADLALLFS